jgi:hypothetical protein
MLPSAASPLRAPLRVAAKRSRSFQILFDGELIDLKRHCFDEWYWTKDSENHGKTRKIIVF